MADEPAGANMPDQPQAPVEVGQATSVGQVRSGNEDSVLCEPLSAPTVRKRGLFCAVADGMGGHAAGEVASSMAVKHARDSYYNAPAGSVDEALRHAIETANGEVFSAGTSKSGRDQMGSTITAAVVYGDRAVVGHVGDSRCYVVEEGRIRQLTRDHSWVAQEVEAGALTQEEARIHPRRNIITRALGLRPEVDVDIYEAPLDPGSILVLCSDGLHGPVRDDEILEYARRFRPQRAVEELISLANQRGGLDNISAVVVKVLDEHNTPNVESPMVDDRPTPTTLTTLSPEEELAKLPSGELGAAEAQEPITDRLPAIPETSLDDDPPTERLIELDRAGASGNVVVFLLVAVLMGAVIGAIVYFMAF